MNRFGRTGTVKYEKHNRVRSVVNKENQFKIIASVSKDPHWRIAWRSRQYCYLSKVEVERGEDKVNDQHNGGGSVMV